MSEWTKEPSLEPGTVDRLAVMLRAIIAEAEQDMMQRRPPTPTERLAWYRKKAKEILTDIERSRITVAGIPDPAAAIEAAREALACALSAGTYTNPATRKVIERALALLEAQP